jgi:hypothetical protein
MIYPKNTATGRLDGPRHIVCPRHAVDGPSCYRKKQSDVLRRRQARRDNEASLKEYEEKFSKVKPILRFV